MIAVCARGWRPRARRSSTRCSCARTDAKGATRSARAINEVSLLRQTYQAAKLRISVDGEERLQELIADGVLLATPAGSTAYNLSANGPILPLDAPLMALTPDLPAFRPRRWRGALVAGSRQRFHRGFGSGQAACRRGRRSHRNPSRRARRCCDDHKTRWCFCMIRVIRSRAHIARAIRILRMIMAQRSKCLGKSSRQWVAFALTSTSVEVTETGRRRAPHRSRNLSLSGSGRGVALRSRAGNCPLGAAIPAWFVSGGRRAADDGSMRRHARRRYAGGRHRPRSDGGDGVAIAGPAPRVRCFRQSGCDHRESRLLRRAIPARPIA